MNCNNANCRQLIIATNQILRSDCCYDSQARSLQGARSGFVHTLRHNSRRRIIVSSDILSRMALESSTAFLSLTSMADAFRRDSKGWRIGVNSSLSQSYCCQDLSKKTLLLLVRELPWSSLTAMIACKRPKNRKSKLISSEVSRGRG